MSILSRLFGAKSARAPREPVNIGLADPRPTFTDRDRTYIRSALGRFTDCGLRISPLLNLDLIIARALIDAERWGYGASREPPAIGLKIDDDPIRELFCVLTEYTDSLTYYSADVEELVPSLANITTGAAGAMVEAHAHSIFENAEDVSIVSEMDGLFGSIRELARLTGGLITVGTPDTAAEYLQGVLMTKRVDIEPVIANLYAKVRGHGQFIEVDPLRSSESVIVAFVADADVEKFSKLLLAPEQSAPS